MSGTCGGCSLAQMLALQKTTQEQGGSVGRNCLFRTRNPSLSRHWRAEGRDQLRSARVPVRGVARLGPGPRLAARARCLSRCARRMARHEGRPPSVRQGCQARRVDARLPALRSSVARRQPPSHPAYGWPAASTRSDQVVPARIGWCVWTVGSTLIAAGPLRWRSSRWTGGLGTSFGRSYDSGCTAKSLVAKRAASRLMGQNAPSVSSRRIRPRQLYGAGCRL
jgi:hypothetical protein